MVVVSKRERMRSVATLSIAAYRRMEKGGPGGGEKGEEAKGGVVVELGE